MRRRASSVILGLVALGCGHNSLSTPVETLWSIDSIPFLSVGDSVSAADPVLLYPASATLLPDGRLAVVDQFAPGVRFFSASGQLLRTVGREGEGPEEFGAPSWMGRCAADSLFVWDYMQGSVTVLDDQGAVARRYVPKGEPSAIRCDGDGVFAMLTGAINPPRTLAEMRDPRLRLRAELRIADANGDSIGSLGIIPAAETRTLGKVTQYALRAERIYVGTADSASIDVYDRSGQRLRTIRFPIPSRAATAANYDRAVEDQVAVFENPAVQEQTRSILRDMFTIPETLPPYTAVLVDPEGILWVVVGAPGDPTTRLLGAGDDGTIVADLEVPREMRIFEIGVDYVLGSVLDDSGLRHVRAYRLRRPLPA